MKIVWPLLFKLFPQQGYRAMAFWPVIFFKSKSLVSDRKVLNHEKIHLKQQIECLVLPFYLIYFGEYLFYRLKLKNHDQAYRAISFEKEAYTNEDKPDYLKRRKIYSNFRRS